jgi:hypothetical protein
VQPDVETKQKTGNVVLTINGSKRSRQALTRVDP